MSLYGITYITYIAIQFAIFEASLNYLEKIKPRKYNQDDEAEHATADICLSAIWAGLIGSVITNPLEVLTVKK